MEINCKKCGNLVNEVQGCQCYGSDPTKAVRACAADGFKNYTGGVKPTKWETAKGVYIRTSYACPVCGSYLALYGRVKDQTHAGLQPHQLNDCINCGQAIDWSDEPKARED